MRLLFVQFGDYREAYYRLAEGKSETYYAQKYTVEWVAEKAKANEFVGVCCLASDPYQEVLPNGVHTYGVNLKADGERKLLEIVQNAAPTHLICCSPFRQLLKWAINTSMRTLPLFADSFDAPGLRSWFRNYRLKNILNNPYFDWVANHNINACLSLERIGVHTDKIIPWDYPAFIKPEDYPIKLFPQRDAFNLLYVGTVSEDKGVGDCVRAVEHLIAAGSSVSLQIVGSGEVEFFQKMARELGVADKIIFHGKRPHEQVLQLMCENDILLVPSRHTYPEGLPLTIYEGFCSHTPLIVSDHPMFLGKVVNEENGMMFRAGDTLHLCRVIQQLMHDPYLYEKLSHRSTEGWKKLQIPVKWDELLNRWLDNQPIDVQWLKQQLLKTLPR